MGSMRTFVTDGTDGGDFKEPNGVGPKNGTQTGHHVFFWSFFKKF